MSEFSYQQIKEDVDRQRYSIVPYKIEQDKVDAGIAAFFAFLKLPQEVKDSFRLMINWEDKGSTIGYVLRIKDTNDPDYKDNKEFIHYNMYLEDAVVKGELLQGVSQEHQAVILEFMQQAKRIYKKATDCLHRMLKEFDREHAGIYDKFFPEGIHPKFYLRFLKYDVHGMGEQIARAHYDRGAITFAIAESAPGLRIGKDEENLQPVVYDRENLIFMPALALQEYVDGQFPPAWHDVVRAADNFSDDATRWALVFFAEPYHIRTLDNLETHTVKDY